MSPIAAAGHTGASFQRAVIAFGFIPLSIAIVPLCGMVLWGLRGGLKSNGPDDR
jgi:hypothetical protein